MTSQTMSKVAWFVTLTILIPSVIFFMFSTIQIRDRDTAYVSSTLSLSARQAMAGCFVFAMGHLVTVISSWRNRPAESKERDSVRSTAPLLEGTGAFLFMFGLLGTFLIVSPGIIYKPWPFPGTSVFPPVRVPGAWHVPYTDAFSDDLQFFSVLVLGCGALVLCIGRLLEGSFAKKQSNTISSGTAKSATHPLILKWGLLMAVTTFFLSQGFAAKRWMGLGFGDNVRHVDTLRFFYAIASWVAVAVALLFALIWLLVVIRASWAGDRSKRVSWFGIILGGLLLLRGLWGIDEVIGVIKYFPYFRIGEVWAICIGAGAALVGRSCLPNMSLPHLLASLVGGAGVALYLVVSTEPWFSPDVPMLWSRGFLGAFLPGLILLSLGFRSRKGI